MGLWNDLRRSKRIRVELTRGVLSFAWEKDKAIEERMMLQTPVEPCFGGL